MHEVMLGGRRYPRNPRLTKYRQKKLKKGDIVIDILNLDPVIVSPKEGSVAFRITSPKRWCKSVVVTFYSGFGWLTEQEYFELRQREPRIAP